MAVTMSLDRIGVGIDTARYGHRVSFLRPDRQLAAQPITVMENHGGYQSLKEKLIQLHEQNPHVIFNVRIDAAGQYAANLEQFLRGLDLPITLSIGEPKRNLCFGRARVIRIILHTCRFFLFRLLAETPEAVDLRNLDEFPSHKRNIHPSAYPPAFESLTVRASPGVPSRVPPCGPTARLDGLRRCRLGAHRQLRHRAFRRNQRRGRQPGVAGRPRSLVLHHSLLTNSRALRQPIRPARRL